MSRKAEIKSINEDIVRRFALIEGRLKGCSSPEVLLAELLERVEEQFHVPFVWCSIITDEKNAQLIKKARSSPKLKGRLNLIGRELFEKIMTDGAGPLLVNSSLKPYFKLFPDGEKYFIKSMAIVPLQINGGIIGCWISADARQDRYQPGMHTDILQKFAEFVSRRLSELS